MNSNSKKLNPVEIYKKYGLVIILVTLFVIASVVCESFLTAGNILSVLRQIAVITIICCGEQIVLVQGDTDLSAGSAVALTGCITATILHAGAPWPVAFLGGLLMGAAIGAVKGFIIAHFRIPSFYYDIGYDGNCQRNCTCLYRFCNHSWYGCIKMACAGKLFGFFPVPVLVTAVCDLYYMDYFK